MDHPAVAEEVVRSMRDDGCTKIQIKMALAERGMSETAAGELVDAVDLARGREGYSSPIDMARHVQAVLKADGPPTDETRSEARAAREARRSTSVQPTTSEELVRSMRDDGCTKIQIKLTLADHGMAESAAGDLVDAVDLARGREGHDAPIDMARHAQATLKAEAESRAEFQARERGRQRPAGVPYIVASAVTWPVRILVVLLTAQGVIALSMGVQDLLVWTSDGEAGSVFGGTWSLIVALWTFWVARAAARGDHLVVVYAGTPLFVFWTLTSIAGLAFASALVRGPLPAPVVLLTVGIPIALVVATATFGRWGGRRPRALPWDVSTLREAAEAHWRRAAVVALAGYVLRFWILPELFPDVELVGDARLPQYPAWAFFESALVLAGIALAMAKARQIRATAVAACVASMLYVVWASTFWGESGALWLTAGERSFALSTLGGFGLVAFSIGRRGLSIPPLLLWFAAIQILEVAVTQVVLQQIDTEDASVDVDDVLAALRAVASVMTTVFYFGLALLFAALPVDRSKTSAADREATVV